MSRINLGVICGLVFGAIDIGIMLPMSFPDKRAAITAAFVARFGIGFVIGAARLPWPGWAVGLFFGLLLSIPDAIITKAYAPIIGMGAVGGTIIGVIIGRSCRAISEHQAADYIAGYCLILDMTAEDILQRNPRFLTRSKNFDTFFSFGPELITPDEVPDILKVKVGTYKNGTLHRENIVANMAFPPHYLVAFHSHVASMYPGDIISTGTPGAGCRRCGTYVRWSLPASGASASTSRTLKIPWPTATPCFL